MKQIFIRSVCIAANRRILHEKGTKTEVFISKHVIYFASKRIFWSKMKIIEVIHCEYLQIFAWMWNLLKVLWLFVSKRIFRSKYLPVWENVKRIFALKRYLLQHVFVLHQIDYLYANLCEYFEVNMKRIIRINGVCEYSKTCENEANKLHNRLDLLRSK